MIIVTVLREKLIHSETIRENQTIKSDRSDDIWCRGRVQFTLVSVNGRKWKIVAFLPEVEISDIRFCAFDRHVEEKRFSNQDLQFRSTDSKVTDPRTDQWR